MKAFNILKIFGLLTLYTIVFFMVISVFRMENYNTKSQMVDFYDEKKYSLDGIYIGPSSVYRYWQAPLAYKEQGIVVLDYSTSNQPKEALIYLIKEVYKRQNPQILIIDIRQFIRDNSLDLIAMHNCLNFMPFSVNKLALTNHLCQIKEDKYINCLEYYFPIIRFHSRWKSLNKEDFYPFSYKMKCGLADFYFFTHEHQNNAHFISSNRKEEISEENKILLHELITFLKQKKINALFVASPFLSNEEEQAKTNFVFEKIAEEGFNYINFNSPKIYEQIKIITPSDWQDEEHLNIKGSIKFTSYFAKILKNEYNLQDRRGDKDYQSWDIDSDRYIILIEEYNNGGEIQ